MTESNEHVSARREPDPKPTSPETTATAIVPAGWTRFFRRPAPPSRRSGRPPDRLSASLLPALFANAL